MPLLLKLFQILNLRANNVVILRVKKEKLRIKEASFTDDESFTTACEGGKESRTKCASPRMNREMMNYYFALEGAFHLVGVSDANMN